MLPLIHDGSDSRLSRSLIDQERLDERGRFGTWDDPEAVETLEHHWQRTCEAGCVWCEAGYPQKGIHGRAAR